MINDLSQTRVGYCLSGGSLKGIYSHTGLVTELDTMGVKPKCIIGTSAGSIVGAFMATDGDVIRLNSVVMNLRGKDYIDKVSRLKLIWYVARKMRGFTGFIKGKKLEKFIKSILPTDYFNLCNIPYYAHTVSMSDTEESIISQGSISKAARASSSIPLVFQLAAKAGSLHWDGGVAGYHGLDELLERHGHELDYVILSDFHKYEFKYSNDFMNQDWTPYHLIMKLLDIVASKFNEIKKELAEKYDVKIITVCPDIPIKVDLQEPNSELASSVIRMSIFETRNQINRYFDER